MILAPGLVFAVTLTAARLLVTREKRARPRIVLGGTLLAFGLLIGTTRLLAFLTQRSLPDATFVNPPVWEVVSTGALAVAFGLFLHNRWKGLQLVLGASGIVLASVALNYHASFGKDAIRIRPLLGFEETRYPYNAVRTVKYVTHMRWGQKLVRWPRFVITFADGSRWSSRDGLPAVSVPVFQAPIFQDVASRSNRVLENVLTIDGN